MMSEFEAIPIEAIALAPELVFKAIELSAKYPQNQWQAYLDALAYLGFQAWLQERLPNLSVQVLNRDGGIANKLKVNDCLLHIVAITKSAGNFIELPIDVVNAKTSFKQDSTFTVVIELQEEIEQAVILGFINQTELIKHIQTLSCDRNDGTCQVPLTLFDSEREKLLLYLQHLELVPATDAALIPLRASANVTNLILNTGLWMHSQLDHIARDLAWQLVPSFQPIYAGAMRSSTVELQNIVSELTRVAVDIPNYARAAYQDFQLGDRRLRLYAMVWDDHTQPDSEWSLLLVLGSQTIGDIPTGLRMRISDQHDVLVERELEPHSKNLYIYACVTGKQDEEFTVSISLPNGIMLTLPAFVFQPDAL